MKRLFLSGSSLAVIGSLALGCPSQLGWPLVLSGSPQAPSPTPPSGPPAQPGGLIGDGGPNDTPGDGGSSDPIVPFDFLAATNFSVGDGPRVVAMADLDGVNGLDLVQLEFDHGPIRIRLNDGTGAFPSAADVATVNGPSALAISDLDGINGPDLIVAAYFGDELRLYSNDGSGGFSLTGILSTGGGPTAIALLDADGVNGIDIAVTNSLDGTVSVFESDGAGGYPTEIISSVCGTPTSIAPANFDGIQNEDLVVGCASPGFGSRFAMLNDGTGDFSLLQEAIDDEEIFIATGDLDGDGFTDVVSAHKTDNIVRVELKDSGSPGFEAAIEVQAEFAPGSITIADVNGDTDPDIIVSNKSESSLLILLNDGTGTSFQTMDLAAGEDPRLVAVGDINGDADVDIAVAEHLGGALKTFTGDGTGAFTLGQEFEVSSGPKTLAIADFNNDTYPDIVASTPSINAGLVILLGDGSGDFSLGSEGNTHLNSSVNINSVATGDINSDNFDDIVAVDLGNSKFSVYLNDGSGGFGDALVTIDTSSGPKSVALQDVTDDGEPDVLIAATSSNRLEIWNNTGAGPYYNSSPDTTILPADGLQNDPEYITTGDINNDGSLDIVTANTVTQAISVCPNDGTGGFPGCSGFAAGFTPIFVALGDLDGDGLLDAIIANPSGVTSISIMFNDPDSPGAFLPPIGPGGVNAYTVAVGDLDLDGDIDIVAADSGSNEAQVYINDGIPDIDAFVFNDSFTTLTPYSVGTSPEFIPVLQDMNGDGNLDVVTANRGSHNISILFNTVQF